MSVADRRLAQLIRRLDMMLARGVLRATIDGGGIQTMQVGLLEGEVADGLERIQQYGLSAVPPAGGDAIVAFLQGNRDHGVVLAVNDRGSRPKGLNGGETCLYNDKERTVVLSADGDVVVKGARNVAIESVESATIKAGTTVTIEGAQQVELTTPLATVNGRVIQAI